MIAEGHRVVSIGKQAALCGEFLNLIVARKRVGGEMKLSSVEGAP